MAYVYADMDALVEFQQQIIQALPILEGQNGCEDQLIASTKNALRAGIERAEAAEDAAYDALRASEEALWAAERQTSEYNAHLPEGQEPIETSSYYYEDVSEKEQGYSYAKAVRAHAEETLADFESYVRRYEQQQADGIEAFKKLLGQSGKFFESYIQKLVEAKKCTAISDGGSASASGSGSGGGGGGAGSVAAAPGGMSVKEAGKQWTESLTKEQYAAVSAYTGAAYQNINAALRGLTPTFQPGYREMAVQIHQALSASSIPQACTVYRGASAAALGPLQNASDEQLVGAYFSDSGFMSTSTNQETAFGGEIKLVIDVPAGAKGAYVGYLSMLGHSENEVLFDMGAVMQITKVDRDPDGLRVIHAQMMI